MITDYLHEKKTPDALHQLSSRERHVLQMLVEGKSAASVARKLHLSPRTIETYKARLMRKLGLTDLPALVKFAAPRPYSAGLSSFTAATRSSSLNGFIVFTAPSSRATWKTS